MRNKSEIHGQLTADRAYLAQAERDKNPALIRYYERRISKAKQALQAIKVFGGEAVPMRTPWRRLVGDTKVFEQL